MQENPSSDHESSDAPEIVVGSETLKMPDHHDFSRYDQGQLKAFFETPTKLTSIKTAVKNAYHIPEEDQSTTLDSPWFDDKKGEPMMVYRIADTREDRSVRHPDIITVSVKIDERGLFTSLPEATVLKSDESAETRSKHLQKITDPAFRRDLEL